MGQKTIDIEDEGVELTISLDRLAAALGEQYIVDGGPRESDFAYLAALAMETMEDGRYELNDTLAEFIETVEVLEGDTRDTVVQELQG